MRTLVLIAALAVAAAAAIGCGSAFIAKRDGVPIDSEKTATLVIRGVPTEDGAPRMRDAERIRRELVALVAASPDGYSVRKAGNGGSAYTVFVYPVEDPAAFAQQIRFGTATASADRTIEVQYQPVETAGL